jgi:hypothetical protein
MLILGVLVGAALAEHHGDHSKDGDYHGKKHGDHVEHHGGKHGDHVEHHGEKQGDREAVYDSLDERLNKVTARIQHIEDGLDKRLDPKLKTRALSLEHRVEELEEPNCDKDHYDCSGNDHECISKLFVCDGIKDCRNGDDEKHCALPTKAGDTFEGSVVFDRCTQRQPEHISFTITAVKVFPAYTAFPVLRARIDISKETDEDEGEVALPTTGYYRFATQNLILLPPEDDGLGLICDFDGHDPDKCIGNIVHVASLEPCARFSFHRKHDDDDHDDEHHDHH